MPRLYRYTAAPLWDIHRVNSTRQALRQFLEWREEEGFTGPFEQGEARRYLLGRYRSGKKWQTVNGDYSAMRKF